MKISNCIVFALGRLWQKQGHLILRKSRYTWVPHFLWAPDTASTNLLPFLKCPAVSRSYLFVSHGKYGLPVLRWASSIEGLYVEHYAPVTPKKGLLFKIFPFATLVFEGSVRYCDAKDCDGKYICSVRKCSSKIGSAHIPTDEEYATLKEGTNENRP